MMEPKDLTKISKTIMEAGSASGTFSHDKVLAAAQNLKDMLDARSDDIAVRATALENLRKHAKDQAKTEQELMLKRADGNKVLQAVFQDPAVHIKSEDDIGLITAKTVRSAIASTLFTKNDAALETALHQLKACCISHSYEESYDLVQGLIKKYAAQLATTPLTTEQAAEINSGNTGIEIGKRTTLKLSL